MSFTLASARNFPPSESGGWTLIFLKRESRYWVTAQTGLKDETLFIQGTQETWEWVQVASTIRWFTNGERRSRPIKNWRAALSYFAILFPERCKL